MTKLLTIKYIKYVLYLTQVILFAMIIPKESLASDIDDFVLIESHKKPPKEIPIPPTLTPQDSQTLKATGKVVVGPIHLSAISSQVPAKKRWFSIFSTREKLPATLVEAYIKETDQPTDFHAIYNFAGKGFMEVIGRDTRVAPSPLLTTTTAKAVENSQSMAPQDLTFQFIHKSMYANKRHVVASMVGNAGKYTFSFFARNALQHYFPISAYAYAMFDVGIAALDYATLIHLCTDFITHRDKLTHPLISQEKVEGEYGMIHLIPRREGLNATSRVLEYLANLHPMGFVIHTIIDAYTKFRGYPTFMHYISSHKELTLEEREEMKEFNYIALKLFNFIISFTPVVSLAKIAAQEILHHYFINKINQ